MSSGPGKKIPAPVGGAQSECALLLLAGHSQEPTSPLPTGVSRPFQGSLMRGAIPRLGITGATSTQAAADMEPMMVVTWHILGCKMRGSPAGLKKLNSDDTRKSSPL